MNWERKFITDYEKLSREELEDRYAHKVPNDITIHGIMMIAKNENKLNKFIDKAYYNDRRDNRSIFLLKNSDQNYEVFVTDRGGKHWLTIHNNLEDAIADKIDLILNNLSHSATDSKIK